MKKIYYALFIPILLLVGFTCVKQDSQSDLISLFERKIKFDTIVSTKLKEYTRCYKIYEKPNEKGHILGYFIYTNEGNKPVGTDIEYLGNSLLNLGTWQTKTDSFRLGNSDTLIIFNNPFKKLHCFLKETANNTGMYTDGYAFKWTSTMKLIQEVRKGNNDDVYIIKYDTLNGKVSSRLKL